MSAVCRRRKTDCRLFSCFFEDVHTCQINFSRGSFTNRCSNVLLYVYEIPKNAFIGRISQAEPKKLAAVVKPKPRRALGIAVDFVAGHLKDKKATEFNTLDKLLLEDLGLQIPFPTIQVIPSESVRSVR